MPGLSWQRKIVGLTCACLLMTSCGRDSERTDFPDDYQPTVLITGANRGMGLEFVRQYAAKDWRVIATARNPSTAFDLQKIANQNTAVFIEILDVTNESQILALQCKYARDSIDVLINNAGIKGALTDLNVPYEQAEFEATLSVNTFAPLRLSQAFIEPVRRSAKKSVVVLASHLGSLDSVPRWGDKEQGSGNYYAISKAAMNMAMRIFHAQVRDEGVKVGLIAPGAVLTDMLRASGRDTSGATSATEAVQDMIETIDRLESGYEFIDRHGEPIAW